MFLNKEKEKLPPASQVNPDEQERQAGSTEAPVIVELEKKSTWIAERIKPTATSQVRFSSQQKTYTSPPSSETFPLLDDSRQVNKCAS